MLRLPRISTDAAIKGIGNSIISNDGAVKAYIHDRTGRRVLDAPTLFLVVDLILPELPTNKITELPSALKEKTLADPRFMHRGPVEGLLSAAITANLMTQDKIALSNNIITQKTELGWIVTGYEGDVQFAYGETNLTTLSESRNLANAIAKLWQIDQIIDEKELELTKEEAWCEEHFAKTVERDSEGRYIIKIPIQKEKALLLGSSKNIAIQRFTALERQFRRDTSYQKWYVQEVRELQKAGLIQLADTPLDEAKPHAYIPHHGVRPPKKPRVVFDGSALTSTGVSFNDIQYAGPRLQNDLFDIILRFRIGKIAITADVQKMFVQVKINKDQWNFQRIVWRESEEEELKEYVLPRVTWGMKSSTYVTIKAMQHCVDTYKDIYPLAQEAIYTSFYVDDLLKSAFTENKALAIRNQLEASLSKGCFKLTKWRSNSNDVLLEGERFNPKALSQENTTGVLGMLWNPSSDTLEFNIDKIREDDSEGHLTKRRIASESAKIYDPNGLLTPVTVRAKMMIQYLWHSGIEWDHLVPTECNTKWHTYTKQLQALSQLHIPRWLQITENSTQQLHIFCDASSKAYGAVVYVRSHNKNNIISTRLITSKSKLATKQSTITIPRLELSAALIGALLAEKVGRIINIPRENQHFWTDSEIVLHWIRQIPSESKMYVANRISTLQKTTTTNQWRHIKSEQNPADLLSRGIDAQELINSKLWWNGPEILKQPDERFLEPWNYSALSESQIEHIKTETKKKVAFTFPLLILTLSGQSGEDIGVLSELWKDHSSVHKILRITAYILRYIKKLQEKAKERRSAITSITLRARHVQSPPPKKRFRAVKINEQSNVSPEREKASAIDLREDNSSNNSAFIPSDQSSILNDVTNNGISPVTHQEYSLAMRYWVRYVQQMEFPIEYACLKKNKPIPKESSLLPCAPFMDENGLIRVGGRIGRSELPYEQKHPSILPGKHIVTLRLMEQAHRETRHGGLQLCIQYLRAMYWITNLRTRMRKIIHNCIICTRFRKQASKQLMAELPAARVERAQPFQHVGVDFAGPFKIACREGRGVATYDAYLCIFVDLPVKANHLELTGGLSTKDFLAALDRMIARRGTVTDIYCDNGRGFVGASPELERAMASWNQPELMEEISRRQIKWHFNTPLAPHHGGLWEASVKRAKYHIHRELGNQTFTFEELYTLFVRIEFCLNTRPMCALKDDPTDFNALTPGHFLHGGQALRPIGPDVKAIPQHQLDRWDRIHKTEQLFWKQWSNEYLVELQRRNKWRFKERNFRTGDLVFLLDDNLPPALWKRARIIQVYPGKDGLVRSVRILTFDSSKSKHRMYDRPVNRLCLLPVEQEFTNDIELCVDGQCAKGCPLGNETNENKIN